MRVLAVLVLAALVSCSDSGTNNREFEIRFFINLDSYDNITILLASEDLSGAEVVGVDVILREEDGQPRMPFPAAVGELVAQKEAWNRLRLSLNPNARIEIPQPATYTVDSRGVWITDPSSLLLENEVILLVRG